MCCRRTWLAAKHNEWDFLTEIERGNTWVKQHWSYVMCFAVWHRNPGSKCSKYKLLQQPLWWMHIHTVCSKYDEKARVGMLMTAAQPHPRFKAGQTSKLSSCRFNHLHHSKAMAAYVFWNWRACSKGKAKSKLMQVSACDQHWFSADQQYSAKLGGSGYQVVLRLWLHTSSLCVNRFFICQILCDWWERKKVGLLLGTMPETKV